MSEILEKFIQASFGYFKQEKVLEKSLLGCGYGMVAKIAVLRSYQKEFELFTVFNFFESS